MQLVGEVQIRFQPAKIGQHRVPVPALCADRVPVVVILRRSAQRHLPVDRRPAAEHATLFVVDRRDIRSAAYLQTLPEIARVHQCAARIGVADVFGRLVRRVVVPRLQQHDLVSWRLRQARRHHAAGRATADHQVRGMHRLGPSPMSIRSWALLNRTPRWTACIVPGTVTNNGTGRRRCDSCLLRSCWSSRHLCARLPPTHRQPIRSWPRRATSPAPSCSSIPAPPAWSW